MATHETIMDHCRAVLDAMLSDMRQGAPDFSPATAHAFHALFSLESEPDRQWAVAIKAIAYFTESLREIMFPDVPEGYTYGFDVVQKGGESGTPEQLMQHDMSDGIRIVTFLMNREEQSAVSLFMNAIRDDRGNEVLSSALWWAAKMIADGRSVEGESRFMVEVPGNYEDD